MKHFLIIISLLLLGISSYVSYLSYSGKVVTNRIQPHTNYEEFNIPSEHQDKLPVKGWLLKGSSCAYIIIVPGWSETSATFLDWAEYWQRNGLNVVVYTPRGGTGHNTMANREVGDLLAVIKWLHTKNITNKQLFLTGHSIGGAVAQIVASQADFGGLILVSSVYNINQTRQSVFKDRGLLFPGVFALANQFTDRLLYGISTVDLASVWPNIKAPTYLLHSTEDEKSSFNLVQERLTERSAEIFTIKGNHRVFLDDETAHWLASDNIRQWINRQSCSR